MFEDLKKKSSQITSQLVDFLSDKSTRSTIENLREKVKGLEDEKNKLENKYKDIIKKFESMKNKLKDLSKNFTELKEYESIQKNILKENDDNNTRIKNIGQEGIFRSIMTERIAKKIKKNESNIDNNKEKIIAKKQRIEDIINELTK
ncbi:hypothetical protein FACS189476_07390 [Spirochaetia bacterium]|nr:hypothetical protein FACS189476_07390 [Spirochaetia bacterium]